MSIYMIVRVYAPGVSLVPELYIHIDLTFIYIVY